jgi:serine protease Do
MTRVSSTTKFGLLGAGAALGIVASLAATGQLPVDPPISQVQAAPTAAPPLQTSTAVTGLPDFASIAERHGPAVVNISVTGKQRRGHQLDPNDPFFEFFRRFGGVPGMPPGRQPTPHSMGSGFIVSADGVILTNAHVVDDAAEVNVKLTDKREFKAKVVGADKATDVAVLRIDAKNLPTVTLGSATQSRVGEWVLAIGSPFGFENTVTSGIISAKSRSLPQEGYVPFLQTDVAINPGNSGGPLFNLKGEVIGINSQIYSRSGGYQGVSFAIPIEVALKVQRQLLATGKVQRGRLGVLIQEVDQALASSFGLDKPMGALVSEVEDGSPASKAGIEPGDVILKFNGQEIGRSAELPPLVADVEPGRKATVEVWRKSKAQTLSVTVGEAKGAKLAASPEGADQSDKLGLELRPLNAQEKRQSGLERGLMVEGVDGPAEQAGIRPGDIVLAMNGTPITSAEQLRSLVDKAGKKVALLIQRQDRKLYIAIDLG